MKRLIILVIAAFGVSILLKDNDYVEIPSSSIRMRVVAASDKEEDQNDKKIIKSALEKKLYELTNGEDDFDRIDETIKDNLKTIDDAIDETIKSNNMNVSFKSHYGLNYFPEKTFKGLTYKAGNYNSYVVTLGEGEGENWWCVLYPPLCLVDEKVNDYEYHSLIKDALSKYN